MDDSSHNVKRWQAPPELWPKLKLLAREHRSEPTRAERILWQHLRRKQLGTKFRRQHAIGQFIVDFYAAEADLVIEVDGGIHQYTIEEDKVRQAYLEACGLRVIRFSNEEVLADIQSVVEEIRRELAHNSQSSTSND